MAINNGSDSYQIDVPNSATEIVQRDNRSGDVTYPRQVTIKNNHGSLILYLGWGASGATVADGYPIPAAGEIQFDLHYSDEVHAIASGAGPIDVRVLVLHGRGNPA